MTQRIGDAIAIEPEDDSKCQGCGKIAETRPYGPGFKRVCFACGMKDEPATRKRMAHKLFDDPVPE